MLYVCSCMYTAVLRNFLSFLLKYAIFFEVKNFKREDLSPFWAKINI